MRKRSMAALLVGLGTLFGCADGGQKVEGRQARELVREGAFLLDVRTPEEFAEGHLPGAVNIPVQVLDQRMDEVPKDRSVVIYCRSGGRSARATGMLQAKGYKGLYDLGAMSNW